MPSLSDSFLQELRLKTDVVDLISSYVSLKKRGNTYVGLCPFHNEKTPSFTVYENTQSFYCFGCGAGGDSVSFMRKIENLDYIDAVKVLAQRAGMQMPDDGYDDSLSKKRRTILEINRETARFYHNYMMSEQGKVGLQYFLNRGLSQKTIRHFGLGYAPNKWDELLKHLKSKGYNISDMLAAGVVRKGEKGYYDYFRNRVMTPIIDVRGNFIAFGGRVLDDSKPKYINTSDTLVYKKTNEVFGLNYAKDSGKDSLILCEGYMDVIAMHQAGFTNAVAGCGTALTNEQVRLLSRYAKEIILVYDNDEAGQKALNKAISLFDQVDIKISIPTLSGGKDPDEIIKNLGRARFADMLENSSNEVEFAIMKLRRGFNLQTTQGKSQFASEAVKILANATPIEQDLYLSRLADELGIEKRALQAQLVEYSTRMAKGQKKREYNKIIDDDLRKTRKESFEADTSTVSLKAQARVIGLLMTYPDCYSLCKDLNPDEFTAGFYKKAYETVTQRIRDNLSLELIVFNEVFTDDEMGKFTHLVSVSQNSSNPKKEFTDCINVIDNEYKKQNSKSTSEMNDDDFRNFFSKKNT
ncbi:DNA primase [Eubacterium coprostanoligenes]|uniref:DNA primase n=1 Tax=Eubacterium coprostanoligenes TaxID=290054 RepID=UPI00235623FB|nr:DNA primase [Eubacterium coprostanoligenes]MCI6253713.1 DNA primase [Eubacterium coprostanoligenes]MDY5399501.1 DNA primase [Eubacterium coprostanoligenes]